MQDSISVLISSAGRRGSLIQCFRRAAARLGLAVEILAVDIEPEWSPACHLADRSFQVPRCDALEFNSRMLQICEENNVALLIPTIDTELLPYARHKAQYTKLGTRVVVPDEEFVAMCRDKAKTALNLETWQIGVPKTTFFREAINYSADRFPLIAKPRDGSCSVGVHKLDSIGDLRAFGDRKGYIFQDLCRGEEHTINCYYSRESGFVCAVPHHRRFVRAGEVCFAQTVESPELIDVARRIGECNPRLEGTLCFQAFVDQASPPRIIEINARFGGGYPIADMASRGFVRWLLQETVGQDPDYASDYEVGLKMLRYDEAVFV